LRTVEPIELSTEPLHEPVASGDTAISCLIRLATQNGGVEQIEAARQSIEAAAEALPLSQLVKLAAGFRLRAEPVRLDWQGLKQAVSAHPVLVVRDSADAVLVTGEGRPGTEEISVWDPRHDGVVFFVSREDFERSWSGHAVQITPERVGVKPFDTSPASGALPEQHAAHGASRRSLRLTLGLAATAAVVSGGIVLFLLTAPSADQDTGPGAPERAGSARIHNIAKPDGTAPLGAAAPEASATAQPHL
jgi:peptidase C39-like protein